MIPDNIQLPRFCSHVRPVTVARLLCTTPERVKGWERTTGILKRGKGENESKYARSSVESLIYYLRIAEREGVSLHTVWRTVNPREAAALDEKRGAKKKQGRPRQKAKPKPKKPVRPTRIDLEHYTSSAAISKAINVDRRTASRYRKTGKAPPVAAALLDLKARGRIMPDSWRNCFFNLNGMLEHRGVGVVNESEVLSINWGRELHRKHVAALESDLKRAESRIEALEAALSAARVQAGQQEAVNDRDFKGRVVK